MADEFDDDDELGDIEEGGAGGGLKKILIIVGGVVLLLIIGGATAYFLGAFDSLFGPSEEELQAEQQQADSLGHFFELEEMLVSMGRAGRKSSFLKLRISLELERKESFLLLHSDYKDLQLCSIGPNQIQNSCKLLP